MNQTMENSEQLSPLQRAYVAIKQMRSKLDAVESAATEPIAIIGMGCRFPGGANDCESFWQILRDGVDGIKDVPAERWNIDSYYDSNPETPGKTYTRQGGFLGKIDEFDAEFFGLHPREVISMDPQQRLLLEVSWEALENAGIAPEKLTGSKSGVFLGISVNEYSQQVLFEKSSAIDVYAATGNALSVAAGRLSYNLGLQGPAIAIDTACSSSLVAVHLACQSLRSGECNLALAGGVYLMLSPITTIAMSKLRALSPDGRCKTFDATADGYGRGEGCGMVALKRLSDAVANGDNILAVIRGSAVNQDGRSSGLTVPNRRAQQEVICAALENAKVAPSDISYVEAHGTGTSLGDPIEVKALTEVLRSDRSDTQTLILGSVKTNIGHLEAAAGIASLIKVVLAMQHGEIPPHLHFTRLNPHISAAGVAVTIPTKLTPWLPTKEGKLYAGVSSFGFSGTNSHVILESFDEVRSQKSEVRSESLERPLHLLTLSAKTDTALKELKNRYLKYLEAHPEVELADICFTANTGRSHFAHRLAVVGDSTPEITRQLAKVKSSPESTFQPKVAFLFPGLGCQYINMGRELFETQPIFRQTLERCDEILRPYLEQPLLQILYPLKPNPPAPFPAREGGDLKSLSLQERGLERGLDETAETQPVLEGDLKPLSLQERGLERGLNETAETQAILFAIEYALAELWKSWGIEPDVVMGHDVGEYVAACVAGIFSLEEGLKLIATELTPSDVTYSPPNINFISQITGQFATQETIATPNYWQKQIHKPVNFSAGIQTLYKDEYNLFIEISPHPTLIDMVKQDVPQNFGTWLPSLEKKQADWQILLSSLATAYMKGVEIDWAGFDRNYQRHRLPLPTYPFQRQRYWIDKTQNLSTTAFSAKLSHPLLDKRLYSPLAEIQFESQFVLDKLPLVSDHRIDGMPVINLVVYLEMVVAAVKEAFGKECYCLQDLSISQALIMPDTETRTVQLILSPENDGAVTFKIFSLPTEADMTAWVLHASGKVVTHSLPVVERMHSEVLPEQYPEKIPSSEFYAMVEKRGVKLGKSCQLLDTVWRKDGEAIAKIKLQQNPESDRGYLLPLGSIDGWIQILSVCFPTDLADMYLLVGLEKFEFYGYYGQQLWGKAKLDTDQNYEESTHGNLWLFDETGVVVAKITNVELRRVSFETLRRAEKANNSSVKPSRQSNISPEKVFATASKQRPHLLEKYLIAELAIALQLNATKISPQQPLAMFVDSLMAYELRNRIETDLQVKLPMENFLGENNITQLALAVLDQLTLANLNVSELSSTEINEDMEEIVL